MTVSLEYCPRQKEVVDLLEDLGEATTGDLAEDADGTVDELRRAINRLESRGVVKSRPNPSNPNQKLRRLTGEWDG